MIDLSTMDTDDLYWATKTATPAPKHKQVQADDESLDDSTSTVKTAISTKSKPLKSVLKASSSTETMANHNLKETDTMTVASQNSAISQLTEQVSQIKMENKQLLDKFDWLADRMEQLFSSANSQTTRCQARGHRSRTGHEVHDQQRSAPVNREPPSNDSPVSSSDEGASSHGSLDCWGNTLETKQEKTVHIVFQNIAGLSKDSEACDMKLDLLRLWIIQKQVDIFGCVELGTCWDLVDYQHWLPQLTRGWLEAVQWSLGYNRLEKHPTIVQPGGTGIAVFN